MAAELEYITDSSLNDGEFSRCALGESDRSSLLKFFSSHQSEYRAATPLFDLVTGEKTDIDTLETFRDGRWCWDSSIIYHFENHDLKLKQEFVDYALKKAVLEQWHTDW